MGQSKTDGSTVPTVVLAEESLQCGSFRDSAREKEKANREKKKGEWDVGSCQNCI